MSCEIADLVDLAGCRAAVDVQLDVWGRDAETVPASLLAASIERGGVLVGAWDGGRLSGFAWSMPGWRDGRPTHWSHMLGVRPEARGRGLGVSLKRAQRSRLRRAGVELVEWTFDPLQAANAHVNLRRLGATAWEYRVNAYGEMHGPLHRGTPTDRLVAEWWIDRPEVARRLDDGDVARGSGDRPVPAPDDAAAHAAAASPAATILEVRREGAWQVPGDVRLPPSARRVQVPVPARFTEMQQQAPAHALAWRLAARDVLTACFARGYRAVDFVRDPATGGGAYVLVSPAAS